MLTDLEPAAKAKTARKKQAAQIGEEAALDLAAELIEAAGSGDTNETRRLLEAGAPISTESGRTAFHAVAWAGGHPRAAHAEACRVLLRHCKQVMTAEILWTRIAQPHGPTARSAIHSAAAAGNGEVLRLLCNEVVVAGGTVDLRDGDHRTPLHTSLEFGHEPLAGILVSEYGADLYAQDKDGIPALALVGRGVWVDARKWLEPAIAENPIPGLLKDHKGRSIWWHAANLKASSLYNLYQRHRSHPTHPLPPPEPEAATLSLLWAAARGRLHTCRRDLADGADPNARVVRGQTALHLACANALPADPPDQPQDLALALLAAGCDPLALDGNGLNAAPFGRRRIEMDRAKAAAKADWPETPKNGKPPKIRFVEAKVEACKVVEAAIRKLEREKSSQAS